MQQTKSAICGICPAGCWVKVSIDEQEKMTRVVPDDASGHGMICKIGEHAPEIVYSEHRLKYPMKRVGKKGTYQFQRINWEEAYQIITEKLNFIKEKYGPESTAVYTGRGSFELSLCDVYQPKNVAISSASSILFPFGSPNTLGVGALCYVSFAMIAPHVTMGGMYFNMFSDLENAEMIIIWGANPATDSPPTDYYRILEAHRNGAKIVVIDPRKTALAKLPGADWIPIKPGTDGALALGLCNILIREDLYDFDFVENWTVGFEQFKTYAQQFRPEIVEEITGVKAHIVQQLAEEMVRKQGVAPVMYTGLEYTNSGVQNIRATFVLWALAGQMDVPGGRCFGMKENQFNINRDGLIPNPDLSKALGRDRFPVYSSYRGESHAISLPESVLEEKPYKIRSLIIQGGSILTSWPQTAIWKKTLAALEFLVCIDRQMTADCAYADLVLPATTMFEINSYMTYGNIFRIRDKIIEPIGEARNDFFIMAELAKRLGYGHLYPQTEDELLEYVLKGTGFSLQEVKEKGMVEKPAVMMQYKKWEKGLLRPDGEPGFNTPSGKFEIASSILYEYGYDALPVYQDPWESPAQQPELANNYPLIFNSGARVDTDFRSQHHGIKGLLKERPEPTVMINTTDACERGINNGDRVLLRSSRGKIALRAFVTDDIIPGAIDANMGGGGPVGPKAWQDANINELTDLQNYDPISGFPVYKALLCQVDKLEDESQLIIKSGERSVNHENLKSKSHQPVRTVYLDHNATTPVHPQVKNLVTDYLDNFYNPSSIYKAGRDNKFALETARRKVAKLLNTRARRIIFTSGGSESNNFVLRSVVKSFRSKDAHIITSRIEHPAVLKTCKFLEQEGIHVTYLPVNGTGTIDPRQLEKAIRPETILISLMYANNETGVIQPVQELLDIARRHQILFHTDAVQAVGKLPINLENLPVDFLSLSGHKFYGLKGAGALFIREGIKLEPLISGGDQENKLRAGTENVLSIISLGKAAELAEENLKNMLQVETLRNQLQQGVLELIPEATVNGDQENRLPNTLNITLPGIRGESLLLTLDRKGINFSSASACKSGSPEPSHVLTAMGLDETAAHCSVRFSLGIFNTAEEVEYTIKTLEATLKEMRERIRFVACR
ncbi:MAG: aminotransferase class V-fold PLP-dependent enzyme [Candidatus Cyclobacteriaceae bacterium M3_2C_046]